MNFKASRMLPWRPFACVLAALVAGSSSFADEPLFPIEQDAAYTESFGNQFFGAVAAGPGEYFSIWIDSRMGGLVGWGASLYGQRTRTDGTIAAPGSIELMREFLRDVTGYPAVAWNGSVYLVAWYENDVLWGMRVDADGTVLDPGGFMIRNEPGTLQWPAIASDGQDFLVVDAAGGRVIGTRVGGNGVILDSTPAVLVSGATALGYVKLAYGGGEYLVTWTQAPNQAIRGCRVLPDGTVLDPGGFNISGATAAVTDPHVDFDGTRFFLVWLRQVSQRFDLWGAHVDLNGVPTTPHLVASAASFPGGFNSTDLAFNGSEHLVALITGEAAFSTVDLRAQRIDINGAAIGAPLAISRINDGFGQYSNGVASVGSQFFALFENSRLPADSVYFITDIQGARIAGDGSVLDPHPAHIHESTGGAWQMNSATSFDGDNYLCVFEDWREGTAGADYSFDYDPDLYAVRVTASGQPIENTAFLVAGSFERPESNPDSVFGGGQHVVVFEESAASGIEEVRMVRILPNGAVLDPAPRLVFANDPTAETVLPKIAWNGTKYCVVWYDNYLVSGEKPLQFALMRTDGTRELGPVSIPGTDDASVVGFEIASNGDEFAVAWTRPDVRVTRISSGGVVLGTQVVETTGNWITEQAKIAHNGDSYLVAWSQWNSSGPGVYARRVTTAGTPMGATLPIGAPAPGGAEPIEILTYPGEFAIVVNRWDQLFVGNHRVSTQRVNSAGLLIGAEQAIYEGPRWPMYGRMSFALGRCGGALATLPHWADMPYNAPRAQGLLFAAGGGCAGDVNGDGHVDLADLTLLLSSFGLCQGDAGYNSAADFDLTGCVELGDLAVLLANFGI